MATAVSSVLVLGNRREPGRPFRLAMNHVQDLSDVARGSEESDVGICCTYLVDAMSGEGADFDEHALVSVERFAERALELDFGDIGFVPVVKAWRARVVRCRRALRLLRERGDHQSASVLYIAHGPPDPIVATIPELSSMPTELRSLARYTDAVEAWRAELVRHKAKKAASGEPEAAIDLSRHRTLLDWYDRCVSSGDALRDALAPFNEPVSQMPGESDAAFEVRQASREARKAVHKERRAVFLSEVHRDALQMLSRAEAAYYGAWLASG